MVMTRAWWAKNERVDVVVAVGALTLPAAGFAAVMFVAVGFAGVVGADADADAVVELDPG